MQATLIGAEWTLDGLHVTFSAAIMGRLALSSQLICELRRRHGDGASAFPVVRQNRESPEYGSEARYGGVFPVCSIRALVSGTYDLFLVSISEEERLAAKIRWGEGVHVPSTGEDVAISSTRHGNVRIKRSVGHI
jgi:hypothetical protein